MLRSWLGLWLCLWGSLSVEFLSEELTMTESEKALVNVALQDLASRANASCWEVRSCCMGSQFTVSKEIWNATKGWSENWHIRELLDSTPRMLERYYTFFNLLERIQKSNLLELYTQDCYFGVVSILLNAVPAVEFEHGLAKAQEVFLLAKSMLQANNATDRVNWTIPREPMESIFPFYLGLTQRTCHGSKLKLYVYDTKVMSTGSVFCSAGQWGIEVMIHRYFASSACRTSNPDEADLFLVPDYRACHYHLAPTYHHKGLTRLPGDDFHSQVIRNHHEKYRRPEDADVIFQELIGSLSHFQRKKGIDHIFIFSDQGFIVNFTHTFPSWRDWVPHSIFMTTEAFTPGCGPSCFSPWKDIIVPGHIDEDRMRDIRKRNKPSSERHLLFNFHGRLPDTHSYYEKNKVRGAIGRMAILPNVSIGDFVEDYFDIIGSSHFCLVPVGTSSWTNHLYTSFFAGCIPVILSDNFVLPFQDLIDWTTVSIRWPEDQVGPELYVYIMALVEDNRQAVEEMKKNVDRAACWFDFYGFDNSCSPYRAILHDLEKRSKSLPSYLYPTAWGPMNDR